jgi:choline dehydrogenase-like flavoprotein
MRDSSNTKASSDKTNESAKFDQDTRAADFAEEVRANHQMLTAKSKSNYDFIIYGPGASGSVVARRLAEHPNVALTVMDSSHRTLRVSGVESLRIADGSFTLCVTTLNTLAPYVVTGERNADILRTEHRLSVDAVVNK